MITIEIELTCRICHRTDLIRLAPNMRIFPIMGTVQLNRMQNDGRWVALARTTNASYLLERIVSFDSRTVLGITTAKFFLLRKRYAQYLECRKCYTKTFLSPMRTTCPEPERR